MSRRIHIVIPDQVGERLKALAEELGERPSTLAATLIRNEIIRQDNEVGKPAPTNRAGHATGRPVWLEPYGGDPEWRRQTWSAIVALHDRYPRHLQHIQHGWWNDEAHTETLSALAAWRAQLDQHGQDPREELAFQSQLADYQQALRSEGGGVASAWDAGPPPVSWIE